MPIVEAEITATAEVEIEVFCAKCGEGLCNQSRSGNTTRRGMPFIEVEPREKCLDQKNDEGYNKGYDDYENEYKD